MSEEQLDEYKRLWARAHAERLTSAEREMFNALTCVYADDYYSRHGLGIRVIEIGPNEWPLPEVYDE